MGLIEEITLGDREVLADVSHEIWASWMKWMLNHAHRNPNGTVTLLSDDVQRWDRQIVTPYRDLSEREKEGDRQQADKILAALGRQRCEYTAPGELPCLRFAHWAIMGMAQDERFTLYACVDHVGHLASFTDEATLAKLKAEETWRVTTG